MREIKFRVRFRGRFEYWSLPEPEQSDSQQFTGLRDKNGQEIYEGDIVNATGYNPHDYTIEFIEGGFCAVNVSLSSPPIDINHFYPSTGCEIEVIGNIRENPELLK